MKGLFSFLYLIIPHRYWTTEYSLLFKTMEIVLHDNNLENTIGTDLKNTEFILPIVLSLNKKIHSKKLIIDLLSLVCEHAAIQVHNSRW